MSKPLAITIDQYLKDPNFCPYCGSDGVTGGDLDPEHIYVYRDVTCRTCDKTWTEEFTLTNITLEDESSSTD